MLQCRGRIEHERDVIRCVEVRRGLERGDQHPGEREAENSGEGDLVFSALTQSGVGASSMVLPESHFTTRQGFEAVWRRLAPEGRVALVFHNPAYAYRALATAAAALGVAANLSDADVLARAVLLYGDDDPHRVLLILQKQPVSSATAATVAGLAARLGLRIIHLPPEQAGGLGRVLGGEITLAQHLSALDRSVGVQSRMVATDDRPYFLDLDLEVPGALTVLLLTGLVALGLVAGLAPGNPGGRIRRRSLLLSAGCIGTGFMLFELQTIGALARAFGDPTAGAVAGLVTVLGAGSATSLLIERYRRARGLSLELSLLPVAAALACLAVGSAGGYPTAFVGSLLSAAPLLALAAVVGVAASAGYAALLCWTDGDDTRLVPWLWAANTAGTLIGGVAAVAAPADRRARLVMADRGRLLRARCGPRCSPTRRSKMRPPSSGSSRLAHNRVTTDAGGVEVREPGFDSIVELAQRLISIPSRGGIDPPDTVISEIGQWLAEHALAPHLLHSPDGAPVGVAVDIGSGGAPRYCLNACLDTAPFGDIAAWSGPPTAAAVRDGWLFGRGAADCKTAISIFSHIGLAVAARPGEFAGTLTLLFDADEHTGGFGGVRAYAATHARPDGVMIGYPGLDEILVGARGFWRGRLSVSGRSGHSGGRAAAADNAVVKAAALVAALADAEIPIDDDGGFPLGPKLTVTGIRGGEGYSVVPDRCVVSVDVRLTPRHDAGWADRLVRELCRSLDGAIPSRQPTTIEPEETWPAYQLPATSRLAGSLRAAVRRALGREVPLTVAGPSNIGNFLAALGTEATCGFGVSYRNLHGADEAIDMASIPLVYDAYLAAVGELISARP